MVSKELIQLGQNIKRIRLEKGISQVELAHKCEFEKGNMYRIEAGKTNPTFTTLLRVANALDVPIEEIVKGIKQE